MMIDIHTHILPGIDDGAEDMDEAIRMAKAAVVEGISVVIATPHHANGKYDNPGTRVASQVQELNDRLVQERIPLSILQGQEIRIYDRLIDDLQSNQAIALHNSPYLLLELPSGEVPSNTEDLIHELRVLRKIPIIAHPERNMELAAQPAKLMRLIELGALSQLTSHSVNGVFGSKMQKKCVQWCKEGLVHFISSDAHNLTKRAFGLQGAYTLLSEKVGDSMVNYFQENAHRLVRGEPIPAPPRVGQTKPWWRIW
ncbi:tyrosine-protein phosphatase [Paenibacillus cremeus]|uniref:Tyrosine-protein phosphatase n=1 Tax=Paenibacillus cremeus TaxID=2163881 RepID=A0A559KE21_9BACL|nr:CpsB/CapC family capsule biosynthesis tyrosine phosphatase [Paenibacillus cremeus]TVY10387.1 tyrosine protein phosphatase [Paenibacillus cremeus]